MTATKPPLICPVCGRKARVNDAGEQPGKFRSIRWLAECDRGRALHGILVYGATEAAMRKRWPNGGK